MQDVTELLFRATWTDDGGAERQAKAIKDIAASSGLTGRALEEVEKIVSQAFDEMSAKGLNFEQIIRRISADKQNFGSLKEGIGAVKRELQDATDAAKNFQKAQQQAANAQKQAQSQAANVQKQGQQQVSQIQKAINNPLQTVGNLAQQAAAALGPVGIAFVAAATAAIAFGKAMFDLVDSQGKAAQETVNLSRQLGISAGDMKRLQVEGQILGVSFQSMQIASRQLAIALEEPTGAGKLAAKTLSDLGVATHIASGAVRQEGAVFNDVIKSLSEIGDHTKMVEEATRLFGSRSSASILALVENYQRLDKVARELGYGDTTQLQETLAKGQEEINKMSSAWELFKDKLAEKISPIVIPVITEITTVLSGGKPATFQVDSKGQLTANGKPYLNSQGQATTIRNGQVAPLGSISDVTKYLSQLDQQAQADSIAKRYLSGVSGDTDALRQRLETLKTSLGTQESVVNNPKGVTPEAVQKAADAATSLRAQIASLEDQIKQANQRESLARQLREDQKYPGLQSPVEFQRLIAQNQKARDTLGPGLAYLADSSPQYGSGKIADAIQKFRNGIVKSINEGLQSEYDRQNAHSPFDLQNKEYAQSLKAQGEIDRSNLDASLAQLKIINDSSRGAAERQQGKAYQLAQLQLGGNNPASVALSQQQRISSATNIYTDQTAEIDRLTAAINASGTKTVDDYKELNRLATERVQMEAAYYKEIDEARIEAQVKLAELQKQELDEYKKQAASIFDALREPGGLGIQKWFRSQSLDLARGLFSNATAPVLQGIGRSIAGAIPGQTNPDGTPTFLGTLTKGTILDSARSGKTPQIVAIDANTKAINLNTAAITGRAANGVAAPSAAPGSIAGAAAANGVSSATIGPDGLPLSAGRALSPFSLSIPGSSGASSSLGPLAKMFSGGSTGGGQFLDGVIGSLSGKGGLFGGGVFAGLNPDAGMSGLYRAGNIAGSAAEIGGGIYESVNQFSKGGASGILGGISSASMTAGQLAGGMSNPVGASLEVFGGILQLFKSLFPNSADVRAAQIANQTAYNQYLAPPTINQNLSSSGGFQTFTDKTGLPQVSQFSKIAETNPYLYASPIQTPGSLYQNVSVNPGQVYTPGVNTPAPTPTYAQTPLGGTQVNTVVTINAIDTQTGAEFVKKQMNTIATGLATQVRNGHPLGLALQQSLIGT